MPYPDRSAAPGLPNTLRIEDTWLVRYVGHHTCGTGVNGHYGIHEPGCGTVPEVDLSTLPGWDEHVAAIREQVARDIEAHVGTEPTLMHVVDWTDGMETAARIARGGAA